MTVEPAQLLADSPALQRFEQVAVLGAGVIGTSWTALFLAHGLAVRLYDPDPGVRDKVLAGLDQISPALIALGLPGTGLDARLSFAAGQDAAVEGADLVQENGPEKIEFKRGLWAAVEKLVSPQTLLLSSTSGHPASSQARGMTDASRLLVAHPFNPPHMVPLVEIVPGEQTAPDAVEEAVAFFRALGKKPLLLRKEVPGFVANRLQSAMFQECVSLVADGVVDMADLDEIVTSSIGMRWSVNGPFLTFHLGGGPGGLPQFLEHLGPGMQSRWASLGHPTFDEPTVALLTEAVERAYGDRSYDDLERERDSRQLAVMRALAGTAVSDEVLYAVDGRVATVTLNRPSQRNAVDPGLATGLDAAMARLEADPEVWVVILTGAGGVFCAGADLKAIAAGNSQQLSTGRGGFGGFVRYPRSKPVIAAVHGFALAGGLELVLACDLVVAADDASFGLPEVTRGIVAAAGGLFRLPRAIGAARARELILTGERFGAAEAHTLGLVNHVVPTDDVLPTARGLADSICRNAPLAVRESLALAREALQIDEAEGWRRSAEASARIMTSEDAKEGPRAFAAKRPPQWSGR